MDGEASNVWEVDGVKHYRHHTRKAVLEAAGMDDIANIIEHAQLRWLGHVLRLPEDDDIRKVFLDDMPGAALKGTKTRSYLKVRLLRVQRIDVVCHRSRAVIRHSSLHEFPADTQDKLAPIHED